MVTSVVVSPNHSIQDRSGKLHAVTIADVSLGDGLLIPSRAHLAAAMMQGAMTSVDADRCAKRRSCSSRAMALFISDIRMGSVLIALASGVNSRCESLPPKMSASGMLDVPAEWKLGNNSGVLDCSHRTRDVLATVFCRSPCSRRRGIQEDDTLEHSGNETRRYPKKTSAADTTPTMLSIKCVGTDDRVIENHSRA